jgi:hypothetical protein
MRGQSRVISRVRSPDDLEHLKTICNRTGKAVALALLACALLIPCVGRGQHRFDQTKELGLVIGTAYYLGDLNPTKHLGGRKEAGWGGYFRYNLDSRLALRANVYRFTIEAWDADSKDAWQQARNLHFRNQMTEVSCVVEVNYINHQIGNPGDRIAAYLFAGIATFNHMPQAEFEGEWYELQPLGTEGQGTTWGVAHGRQPYSLMGLALPFGFGFKVNMGPFAAFNVEWGVRKTWNDYLDDVSLTYADAVVLDDEKGDLAVALSDRSEAAAEGLNSVGRQRGNPGVDDRYGWVNASLSFRIGKKPTTCWNQ